MKPSLKNHRPPACLADHPVHHAAVATALHIWEMHIGTVQLFLVGPGPDAWLACSEPCYSGQVGTDEERNLARRAAAILNRDHRQDKDAGPNEIRAALQQAGRSPVATQESEPASDVPSSFTEFEIVADPTMPWKCTACAEAFEGPTDRAPRGGCPYCGSHHVFDCNVAAPSPPPRRNRIRHTPPAHPEFARRRDESPDRSAILATIQTVAETAGVTVKDLIAYAKTKQIARARHLAIATVRERFPSLILDQLGELFHRDQGSIRNACLSHGSLLKGDAYYQNLHARVQSALHATA